MQHVLEDSIHDQGYGAQLEVRFDLQRDVRHRIVASLNSLLVHSMSLRDLYRKAPRQVSAAGFHEMHTLFGAHHRQQLELCHALAGRVQALGGVPIALVGDVGMESRISGVPSACDSPEQQLAGLVGAHEMALNEARSLSRQANQHDAEDGGDLIVNEVIRTNELQSLMLSAHLVGGGAP